MVAQYIRLKGSYTLLSFQVLVKVHLSLQQWLLAKYLILACIGLGKGVRLGSESLSDKIWESGKLKLRRPGNLELYREVGNLENWDPVTKHEYKYKYIYIYIYDTWLHVWVHAWQRLVPWLLVLASCSLALGPWSLALGFWCTLFFVHESCMANRSFGQQGWLRAGLSGQLIP